MEIILAKSAGFCYGVAKAYNRVYNEIGNTDMVCLGSLIHNKNITRDLAQKNVQVIESVGDAAGKSVVIRAHGVGPAVYDELDKMQNKYIDCTCPDVKKIHTLVSEKQKEGFEIIIIGDKNHPEIIGANAWAHNSAHIFKTPEQANEFCFDEHKKYAVVVQTTFAKHIYEEICVIIKQQANGVEFFDTICNATELRQREAEEISSYVDKMIVLGDKSSANTGELYEICKKNCENSFFVESIIDLELNIFGTNDKIGITAGASTPSAIIKEAVSRMSELDNENVNNDQTFEQMLDESFVTLHTGDVVKGIVIQIANGEVSVNLGYKSDGVISRTEFSENQDINPADVLNIGDEIEVFVVRVNDGEGNVLLSKKRLEMQKGFVEIEQSFNDKTTVKGKISEVVKGGLICLVKGVRVFVPSSQITGRYVDDLVQFVGKEFDFNILEYDRGKRRIVAGRRELAVKEENAKKEKLFGSIEEGQKITGKVSRVVDFGAFVDIGGADGLIHISEMSWGRVKKVSDVLKEGDIVTVTVLKVDKEKEKISLSLKEVAENPWNVATTRYPVGSIVEGKVVRMVPFGAFVELEAGVDGLVHISQIAQKHVAKPEDELKIGEVISVKVVEVDIDNKKISLSKKEADGILHPELLEQAMEELAAANEQAVEETAPEAVVSDESVEGNEE